MLPLRVTALGLTGLLLVATPSSLVPDPAAASRPVPSAPTASAAPAVPAPAPAEPDAKPRPARSQDSTRRAPMPVEVLPPTSLTKPANGAAAVRRLGDDLREVAKAHGLTQSGLRATLRNDETVWVAPSGRLFVKEQAALAGGTFAGAEVAAASAPLDQTFALHSLPGSRHVIHLDFDGADLDAASEWTQRYGLPAGAYEGWDPMGDGPAFSDAERTAIQEIWARVAEDYAPFDVDVTTADPGDDALRVDAPGDTVFGTRLVVTDSADASAVLCPDGCGGVAWIGQVDRPSAVVEPAWVFASGVSQSPKGIAEAAAHEVGHTFGLQHHGVDRGNGDWDEYYTGNGSWAPIMGAAYDRPVSQWSNGFYDGATNRQDDVALISAIAGTRTDEGGDGWASPLRATDGTAFVNSSTDSDVYLVDDCTAGARVAAVTAGFAADLDVGLTLAQPSGTGATVVTSVNPLVSKVDELDVRPWYGENTAQLSSSAAGLDASVDVPDGGPWLLQVRGVEGLISEDGATDYFSYGSLGAYHLEVEGCSTPAVAPARPTGLVLTPSGADLVAAWGAPTNDGGSPTTGYRLTLNGDAPVDLGPDATTYTFVGAATRNATVAVRAVNAIGAGAAATATANPTTVPSQVTDVTFVTDGVTCRVGERLQRGIRISWYSPADDGGSPVTGYRLLQGLDGEWWPAFGNDLTSSGGYENPSLCYAPVAGERYDYRIVAFNANGAGEPYDFTALLKGPPARITPTISTDRDARTVTVDWETPFDGGEPIERILLTLTDGIYENPRMVTLPPGTTSYTFDNVKTGHKHILLAASNVWGPTTNESGARNSSDTSFEMPPISPFPALIPNNTVRVTAADKATGSLRVAWDPAVPADPDHDPILWYDVCVDVIGEIHLPGDAAFGDGAIRGTDLCGDRTTLALTADATDAPYIDLTGLSIGQHTVVVTPVNPGGPAYLPAIGLVDFVPTAIICPETYDSYRDGQLVWRWDWTEINVNYWSIRARRAPDTAWTVWAETQVYNQTAIYQRVDPGQWEIEVTAHLRSGRTGAPVVCAVTVPEPGTAPTPEPTPEPTPDPTPEPTTDPTPGPTPEPTPDPTPVPTSPPAAPPAPPAAPAPVQPAPAVPAAPTAPKVKPGGKGGARTITATWSAPASTGSAAVTTYEVVVYKVKGGKLVAAARKTVSASKRRLVLKLKPATYKIVVRARNGVGWSAASAYSKAVKPR